VFVGVELIGQRKWVTQFHANSLIRVSFCYKNGAQNPALISGYDGSAKTGAFRTFSDLSQSLRTSQQQKGANQTYEEGAH
jgi:hypothetical protein